MFNAPAERGVLRVESATSGRINGELLDTHYVFEVDAVDRDSWASMLQTFHESAIYQMWPYGAMRWGEDNLSHAVLGKDGEIAAAAQARIIKLPVLRAGIAYIKWGPMWQRRGKEKDWDSFRQMARALREEYVRRRGLLLRVMLNEGDIDVDKAQAVLKEEGFELRLGVVAYRTIVMDLSRSLDELRRNAKRTWRQNLRRAEQNNLKIIEGVGDDLFKIVEDLYKEMRARKKFIAFSDTGDLRAIQRELPDPLKMHVAVCEFSGEPVAALVVSQVTSTAIALVAATGGRALELNGSYLLWWRTIERLKAQGCRWFDVGGIDPTGYPGTYQFKVGLAGKSGRDLIFRQFEARADWLSSFVVQAGEHLREDYRALKVVLGKLRKSSGS